MSMTTSLVLVDDGTQTRGAIAGFLAGYCGATRRSYATDLRIFAAWCSEANLTLFAVRRAHLELFGRWMEENGRMRSTVARRLSTLASFYRYCQQEALISRNPAANVRRPKVDYESRTLGLDRSELGAFLVQAGLGSARDHALASLLALNGLRISEALGADVEDLEFERGHRTLKVLRKGGKHAVVPLGTENLTGAGPVHRGAHHRADLSRRQGRPRWTATRLTAWSSAWPGGPASPSASVPIACATASSPPPSTPASRCVTYRRPPATPTPAPPCATTGAADRSIATPPTWSPPSWPAPPADLVHRRGGVTGRR